MLALATLAIFAVAEVCAEEVAVANELQAEQPQMATFKGGNLNDFKVWVEAEVAKRAAATNKAGRVIVAFNVMGDGTVVANDKPAMNSQADAELFAEVRRIVESSTGMWELAVQNGNKVNVSLVVPINCEKVKASKPAKKIKPAKKERKAKR